MHDTRSDVTSRATHRDAAILLASLDAETADALIEQMPDEAARRMRDLMMDLDDIDTLERDAVIAAFLAEGFSRDEATPAADADVEIDVAFEPASPMPRPAPESAATNDLGEIDTHQLARYLENELPQTAAVAVSLLAPGQAADVLGELPPELQADVLRRMAALDAADPEVVLEVRRGIEARLLPSAPGASPRGGGSAAVDRILRSAGASVRDELLANLQRHDPHLARRFGIASAATPEMEPLEFEFDDLARLTDLGLAKVISEASADLLRLALAAARPAFVARILEQLPRREARRIRRALDQLGPTRLADVEHAQRQLVAIALRLDAEGRLELLGRRTLSMTI